jgi:bifunctional non-homologous end joining protein LigD
MSETWDVGGLKVELTHPERILFPKDGITKADLAAYYREVAPAMLAHISGRPLHMQRFPRGIGEEGFVQKSAPENTPDWVHTATVEKEGGHITHIVASNPATLVYLANLACTTPHIWQSRADNVERPDRMVFDLDPPEDDFRPVRAAANQLRGLLDKLGLPSFPMTTGSRGLHVVVPLLPELEFDDVRAAAQQIARDLIRREPDALTMEMRKEDREGRLFVDTLRNSYAATAVAPYAVRATDGAPVATPVNWDDLENEGLTSRSFNLKGMSQRLADLGDVWSALESNAVSLTAVRDNLQTQPAT